MPLIPRPPYDVIVDNWPDRRFLFYRSLVVAQFVAGAAGSDYVTVPGNSRWIPLSIVVTQDASEANDQAVHVFFLDPAGNPLFGSGSAKMIKNTRSLVTFGIGLNPRDTDNGQLPPFHYITETLPPINLEAGYSVKVGLDNIVGPLANTTTFWLFFIEEYVRT